MPQPNRKQQSFAPELSLRLIIFFLIFVFSPWLIANTQLNIWHMSKEMDADIGATASAFSDSHPDIDVAVHFFPNEELKASAVRAIGQQAAPDIIIISSDNVGFAKVMRLSELPTELAVETLPTTTLHALKFDNKHYSVPLFAGNHLILYYNKTLVKTPAADWEQLFIQHAEFKAKGVKTLALNYQEPYWFSLFASLFGADLTIDGKVALDSDAMQQALQFYKKLGESDIVNMQCGYECVSEDFFQGRYAYAINGTWSLSVARERLGENLGIALFPKLQQRQITPLASYIVMIFPNQSLTSDKALQIKQLVQYFRQPENLQSIAEKHYLTPYYQTDKTTIDALQHDDPLYLQLNAQRKLTKLMPASTAMVSVWNGMQKGMLLYQNSTLDASATVSFMQSVSTRDQKMLEAGL